MSWTGLALTILNVTILKLFIFCIAFLKWPNHAGGYCIYKHFTSGYFVGTAFVLYNSVNARTMNHVK